MKNYKIFSKLILVFFSLILVGCIAKDNQPKIRIVDMQGHAKPIVTRMPDLNAQAMASQGRQPSPQNISPASRTDFGSASSQAIQQTLQSSQAQENHSSNNAPLVVAGTAPEEKNEAVEYDLSDEQGKAEEEKAALPKLIDKKSSKKFIIKKPAKEAAVTATEAGAKKFFVQVGSFTNQGNAEILLGKMKKFHSGKVEVVEGERSVYRVWLGPFPNRLKANAMVKKISASGHEAILVKGR